MPLTGEMLIGAHSVKGTAGSMRATNPATCALLEPEFFGATTKDVDAACSLAEVAFDTFRAVSLEQRAAFLEAIAQGLIDLGDELVERVMAESGLPLPRIEGERGRTVGQLRLLAKAAGSPPPSTPHSPTASRSPAPTSAPR